MFAGKNYCKVNVVRESVLSLLLNLQQTAPFLLRSKPSTNFLFSENVWFMPKYELLTHNKTPMWYIIYFITTHTGLRQALQTHLSIQVV